MAHAHEHSIDREHLGARLLASVAINVVILVAQLVGGMLAGSLALIADALHNLTDVASLLLSYGAFRVSRLAPTERYTFAFQRADVLAATINGATLIAVSVFVAIEAVERLAHPQPVAGGLVIVFALFGMVANGVAAWLLRGHGESLNVRSAVLHLASDSLASFGVLIAGVLIKLYGWYFVDPLVSIALAVWMTFESVKLLRSAGRILMQGVPEGVELEKVDSAITSVRDVEDVHDLRVWALAPDNIVLSAHLVMAPDLSPTQTQAALHEVKAMLHGQFGVEHATLETELAGTCAGTSCEAEELETAGDGKRDA